jgi:hypothetical protein
MAAFSAPPQTTQTAHPNRTKICASAKKCVAPAVRWFKRFSCRNRLELSQMTLSAARRFADTSFGLMLASEDKLRAAFKVIAERGTGNAGQDAPRLRKLSDALANRA